MEDGRYVPGSVWIYAPNKGAPVFFALAFLASGAVHSWQAAHYQSWRLTWLYIFSSLLFVVGFVFRALGAFDYGDAIKYIVSICFCYAASPLYELGNYHILGRILYYVPYHSPIHPGRVLTTFAAISTVIEALNGTGASYVANRSLPQDLQQTGRALLRAALILQLVVVSVFVVLAATFQARCRRAGVRSAKVDQALLTMYVSTALIMARCVYRTVEFFDLEAIADPSAPGFDPSSLGPLLRHEWFFYVFEAAPMLCNAALLGARHPRRWLPKSTKVYLARDGGGAEVAGPGYADGRGLAATLLDPFDVYGMLRGRDGETRFWDDDGIGGTSGAKARTPEPV